ncbi:MAG: hypothetical protein U9N85_08050 [Bacteroidota bacterium]|nr:hypothetical protein [Bacteroidota bacterium]
MKLKKNVKILFIVIVLLGIAITTVYITGRNSVCKKVELTFSDTQDGKFIDSTILMKIIRDEYGSLIGRKINEINIGEIEEVINKLPLVKKSEVYKNAQGVIFIEVNERTPLFRVMSNNGKSMYVDTDGFLIPISKKTPARVIVTGGHISLPDTLNENNQTIDSTLFLREIFDLVNFINKDEFMNAQFQQIYITENSNFLLIPRIGNHQIILGSTENYKAKLNRLQYFYMNIIGKKGWNTYQELDLSIDNQIVARK